MKQQKSTLLDKLITIIVRTTNVFEQWNFHSPERLNIKVFKTQLGEKWDEIHRVYNKGVKVPNILYFRQHSPNF